MCLKVSTYVQTIIKKKRKKKRIEIYYTFLLVVVFFRVYGWSVENDGFHSPITFLFGNNNTTEIWISILTVSPLYLSLPLLIFLYSFVVVPFFVNEMKIFLCVFDLLVRFFIFILKLKFIHQKDMHSNRLGRIRKTRTISLL